jgi:seryl-tRNA synthetase
MLDIKLLRENFDGVKKNVESRQRECSSIKKFKEIDGE